MPFGALLLGFGKLRRRDTELVILRVAHLRGCAYELQQHRRIAQRRGVDAETQARICAGPTAEGLAERDRALLSAVDELIDTRTLSEQCWQELATYLDRPQLIEFVTLIGQYDALAATLNTLRGSTRLSGVALLARGSSPSAAGWWDRRCRSNG